MILTFLNLASVALASVSAEPHKHASLASANASDATSLSGNALYSVWDVMTIEITQAHFPLTYQLLVSLNNPFVAIGCQESRRLVDSPMLVHTGEYTAIYYGPREDFKGESVADLTSSKDVYAVNSLLLALKDCGSGLSRHFPIDGSFGLAPQAMMDKYFRDRSLSANLPSEVWIKAAKAAGKVTRALVALVPAHNEVLFGTIPTRLMEGPITWVRNNPQSSSVKWKINIAVPELAFSGLARLETAMYSFTLPSPAYQRYLRILDMRDDTSQFYDDDVHLLALSNDAVPAPLTIQFGNRAIVLNGHQQMMPRRSARADAPRHTIIDKPGMDDEMILGRGFLRHFVVVLDYDENMVGLALLRSPSSSEELDDICARRVVRARRVLGASYAPYASRNAGIKCIRSSNYSFDEKASVLDEQGGSGAQSQPSQEYKSVDGLYVRV